MDKKEEKNIVRTALVSYLCPACGGEAEQAIALNSELTEEAAKEVGKMHNKAIGWSDHLCKECAEYKDYGVFFIGIDPEKSKPNNPYRTGHLSCVKNDTKLVEKVKDHIITLKDGGKICFIEDELGDKLGIWNE